MYRSYLLYQLFSCCTLYITDIFLTALIPIKPILFKQIIRRRHSSRMTKVGTMGIAHIFPSSKKVDSEKKNRQSKIHKKTNILDRDLWKSHWNPLIMLIGIFNLNQRQRKGTQTQKVTKKPQVTSEWVINKQCVPCTNIFKLQPWLIGKQQMTTAAVRLPLVSEWETSLITIGDQN